MKSPNKSVEPTGGSPYAQSQSNLSDSCLPLKLMVELITTRQEMKTLIILVTAALLVGCAARRGTADYTTVQSAICDLHHISMTTKRVDLDFGMRRDTWALELRQARRGSFPHAD